jgi:hypothetical protein
VQAKYVFFINLRASFTADKEWLGLKDSTLDVILGNSSAIRKKHYILPMDDAQYAQLGNSVTVMSVALPRSPSAGGWFTVVKSMIHSVNKMFSPIFCLTFPAKIPTEIPAFPIKLPLKLPPGAENIRNFSDALKLVCRDRIMIQKATDFVRSNPNLQCAISKLNLVLERDYDEIDSRIPQQDFMQRELHFIQKFTKHFTDFVEESIDVEDVKIDIDWAAIADTMFRRNIAYRLIILLLGVSNENSTDILQ